MKRKLVSVLIVLTLGIGYCTPPKGECEKLRQDPAVCRGFIKPSMQ